MNLNDLRWHPINRTRDMSQRFRDKAGKPIWFVRRVRTLPTPSHAYFECALDADGEMIAAERDPLEVLCALQELREETPHEKRNPNIHT